VYPNHGVGIIEQINFGVMNGRTEKYYMFKNLFSGLKVMVRQQRDFGWLAASHSQWRNAQGSGFLEKGSRIRITIGSIDSRKIRTMRTGH